MKVIKGVLEEELENSIRQEAAYIKALEGIACKRNTLCFLKS